MTRKVSPASGMDFRGRESQRGRGAGFGDLLAAIIEHGADLAEGVADDVAVTDAEGAVLHEDGGDGAAAAVELGFDDGADSGTVGRSLLLVGVGDVEDHLLETVEIDALLGRDLDELSVAAHADGLDAARGKLHDHTAGIGLRLIDLVDGDDDGNLGGLGVIDGFEGLGHDAVVGGHDHDDDVGDLGAACTHAGEGLVAGGIEEDDLAAEGRRVFLGDADLVGTDVLGDAAGFASGDVGGADGVEQRGLAVIDVAHDGDDGRTHDLDEAGGVLEEAFDGFVLDLLFDGDDCGVSAELAGDGSLTSSRVERLVDGDHDAAMSRVAMRSLPRTSSFSARSLTEMPSVTVMVRVMGRSPSGICAAPHARGVTLEGDFLVLDVALVAAAAGGRDGQDGRELLGLSVGGSRPPGPTP